MTDREQGEHGRGDEHRLFTWTEANSLIPVVRPLLEELAESKRAIDAYQARLQEITPRMRGNGRRLEAVGIEERLERTIERIARLIREIASMGIQLKDIEQGIIDFPALHRGRVVSLCWRLGEQEIAFWHEISAGFAGRRPISEFGR